MKAIDKIIHFLKKNEFVTLEESLNLGMDKMSLSRMVKKEILYRPYRQIYTTSQVDWFTHHEHRFAAPCSLYPDAIIWGISALNYYNLTDEFENKIWLAFPRSHHVVNQEYRIISLQGLSYTIGVKTIKVNCRQVRIYDCEKTIVDSFKHLPIDVALKALKGYLKRKDKNVEKLLRYSHQLRKPLDKVVTVLLADE